MIPPRPFLVSHLMSTANRASKREIKWYIHDSWASHLTVQANLQFEPLHEICFGSRVSLCFQLQTYLLYAISDLQALVSRKKGQQSKANLAPSVFFVPSLGLPRSLGIIFARSHLFIQGPLTTQECSLPSFASKRDPGQNPRTHSLRKPRLQFQITDGVCHSKAPRYSTRQVLSSALLFHQLPQQIIIQVFNQCTLQSTCYSCLSCWLPTWAQPLSVPFLLPLFSIASSSVYLCEKNQSTSAECHQAKRRSAPIIGDVRDQHCWS